MKALVVDDDGVPLARASASYGEHTDGARHEQDANDYLGAITSLVS